MKLSQNTTQKWTIFFGFLGDILNLAFSVFCAFFIPLSNFSLTFEEYKIVFLLLSNFLAFSAFVLIFVIEIKREVWLTDHFDYSKRYSSLHLSSYRQKYPQIFDRLFELNWKYYFLYNLGRYIYYLNFLYTFVTLSYFYFDSYKTIINLFSGFWFCNSKLTRGLKIAEDSLENNAGFSYYNTLSLSFNRIDPKFKRHNSTSNPESNADSLNNSLNGGFLGLEETHL